MSLRFIDSFDHYSTADLQGSGYGQKWTSYYGFSSGVSQITGNGRFGNCLSNFTASGNNLSYITKILDNQATWIIGFAYKATTIVNGVNNQIVALYDFGTAQCDLRLNISGQLYVTRNGTILGTSTNAITANTWNYIELKITINNTTGTVDIHVNNVSWLSLSAQNTRNTTNNYANQIIVGGKDGYSSTTVYYDDFYVCDGTGSTNNDFLGDCRVECRLPLANGSNTDWTAIGSTAAQSISDVTPNGDQNYIYSNTTNQISTFTLLPLNSTPSSTFGVQTVLNMRKSDAGSRTVGDTVKSGTTTNVGSAIYPGTSYAYFTRILETDPNTSSAWGSTALNSIEIGAKLLS